MIQNPILSGFYPDPSICRVDNDYYLVTSSFSYFPGVPVFHSTDLTNWEQIGHVLNRKEQVHLTYEDISAGIFAPTIRWHDGTFYLITTNMTTNENFFCTAENPSGPWSNPIVIDASGIDPSLFWDEDGKAYYTGTAPWNDDRFNSPCIVCSEIDLTTGKLKGEMWEIGSGCSKIPSYPEAPHIYKKDGWYYLMIAEGGTEHYHCVTISRSKNLHEPFEQCPHNPILTHRHLGKNYPICNVGHADLVECQDGSWYAVCLASRLIDGYHKPLGRESFIVPVIWEDGWPIFSPDSGKVEKTYPAPSFAHNSKQDKSLSEKLDWNYLGTPYENFVNFNDNDISVKMLPKKLVPWEFEGKEFNFFEHMNQIGKTKSNIPFIGVRMKEANFIAETLMETNLNDNESAGMILLQNNANQLRLEAVKTAENNVCLKAIKVEYSLRDNKMHYEETLINELILPYSKQYKLKICGNNNKYSFFACSENEDYKLISENADGTHLSSDAAGGFVGTYIGLFACSNGCKSENSALFKNFKLIFNG